jgi:hypothetical protein
MIRDLFHTPPIFKANIVLSWKPRDAKGKVSIIPFFIIQHLKR